MLCGVNMRGRGQCLVVEFIMVPVMFENVLSGRGWDKQRNGDKFMSRREKQLWGRSS